jgi:uncharacterized cupredoxin-like copper-binding protein
MKNLRQAGIAAIGILLVSASAQAYTAGEPGDATKPARIVQVTMTEAEGKMLFLPNRIEIKKDEQVKFMLRNNGELDHEFILGTTAENLKHAESMKKIRTWSTTIPTEGGLLPRRRIRSYGGSPRSASSSTPA